MLRSYLTIALRNIMRSKAYSFINIAGLSLGIGCCLILALYIQNELSYDKHHNRLEDLYRITTHLRAGEDFGNMGTASPPIAMVMKEEVPEVEQATRLVRQPGVSQELIKYDDKLFYEQNGFIADSTLFDVFTYEFLEGNPDKALVEANSVVVSDKLAGKLFGHEPALNKLIDINQLSYKVTGVFRDNDKTHVYISYVTSMTSSSGLAKYLRSSDAMQTWGGENFIPSYVKLVSGHNKDQVVRKMNQIVQKYGAKELKEMGFQKTLGLEPVKDIYLRSNIDQSPRITSLYIMTSIAVFILVLACINFMNLSTARATKRANEIGLRKVMGAYRSSLMGQILGEALVIVLFSILLSVLIVQLSLPFFNELADKHIALDSKNIAYTIAALSIIAVATSLLAGSYPAFYLSSFQPALVLKGKFNMSSSSGWLRRALVVFQFTIAIVLVCGMIIISKQLKFMQEEDLGFDSKAKIVLPLRTPGARQTYDALTRELSRNKAIKLVSGSVYLPGQPIYSDMNFYKEGGNMNQSVRIVRNRVDHGYIELLGIKMIAGRTFTSNREQDASNKVIVNQTAVKSLGLESGNAIGQHIFFDWQGQKSDYEIIGVMEDFHQLSMKKHIESTLFALADSTKRLDYLIADIEAKDFDKTIASMEQTWKGLISDTPFEYSFLDDNIQKQYSEDQKTSAIISSFTFIAMLISCLGLYGLSTYMAERRFKEIGVRKVLGANVNQIVGLMSKEFIKLVMAAFVISVPVAWYVMDKWLQEFAYKITINIYIFLYAGVAAMAVALITVSFESIRAASANPVNALRNE